MTDYLTEEEQVQQLKNWVKQYGLTILAGILLALAITTGWHYYQDYRNKILIHASSLYDEMLAFKSQGNIENSLLSAKKLIADYSNTPYSQMAALLLAQTAVNKQDYDNALKQLAWVVDRSKDPSLRQIARLRSARIMLTQKKYNEALDYLNKVDDKNFAGLIDEAKGDIHLAMNNIKAARDDYAHALQEIPQAESLRPILQMKFDNLAE